MKKKEIVEAILGKQRNTLPAIPNAQAFAPTNIALCKYWGKRDRELNLPLTSSLSISLGKKGTRTEVKKNHANHDEIVLNQQSVDPSSSFCKRLIEFLDMFRTDENLYFHINTETNIPTAAGLASSASGFAALVLALNKWFNWNLKEQELSILARLGSGSACRSIWPGFVEWQMGKREDGMDSYGVSISEVWPELCIGLMIVSGKEKPVSSREAMQRTVTTSPFYSLWPAKVNEDMTAIKPVIQTRDFDSLGKIAESDAMAMHALMLSAWPPINYACPETVLIMQKVWELRRDNLPVYFTQDAGPNLKLIFLKKNISQIQSAFPKVDIIQPFIDK